MVGVPPPPPGEPPAGSGKLRRTYQVKKKLSKSRVVVNPEDKDEELMEFWSDHKLAQIAIAGGKKGKYLI